MHVADMDHPTATRGPGQRYAEFFEYEVLGKFQTRPLPGAEFLGYNLFTFNNGDRHGLA